MLSVDTSKADLVRDLSILFVEDDADVRESMSHFLSRRVKRVHTAHNGIAGLNSFRELRPDLVISDIRMGGMDGLTMCKEIRAVEPELPVIIISAHNENDILLSSIDLGVTKFIVKPVDTDVLMKTIAGIAQSIERRRMIDDKLQQHERDESDYDSECVKSYVSRYMEGDHHEELSNIRHLNIPKLGVSGDFYSVAKYNDDLYVMVADGAGHGLSAVIPALQIPGIFQQQAGRGLSLLAIAAEINRKLHDQHFAEHFVAATLIHANSNTRFVEVLNCGNPPVLIYDDDGDLLHVCRSKSTALGIAGDDEFAVESERFRISHDARIYLFTDGLVDTLHASSLDFDQSKLEAMLSNRHSSDAFDEVSRQATEAARNFKIDDITMLEIRFEPNMAQPDAAEALTGAEAARDFETAVDLKQISLLYVEDDELTRDYLTLFLNRRLGAVHVAKDGREGLEMFRAYRPDIILTDIKMPQLNGLLMAEKIRELDKDVPIIVTSGFDDAKDAETMFEMGVSRFQMKPLDPAKLTDTIHACLRQARTLDRLRRSASAFEFSSLAVITTDANKRIVSVNPSFSRLTGYNLADLAGQNPTLLGSGMHDSANYQVMWDAVDHAGGWSGELPVRYKNGTTVFEWLTVNAVRSAGGAVTGYNFVFSDVSERQLNEEKLRRLMSLDSLTQLPNRNLFSNKVNAMLEDMQKTNGDLALIYFNIDRFIDINNVLGVRVGDEVLFVVAQRLLEISGGMDMLCRMGSDEFALAMQDGGRDSIERAVTELSKAIGQPINVDDKEVQLRLSIGISVYPSDGATFEELVMSASRAMNNAQLAGGNTYRFFDKSVNQREERQAVLQQGIGSGLRKGEFFMLYQPKYSLSKKLVVGAEALVRWSHPVYGTISPAEFIPLAEGNGTVIDMSEWIIDTVCAQIAGWKKQGMKHVPVSINISPVHFWRGDLVQSLLDGLRKWGVDAADLPIEVTENVVMNTSDHTLQMLERLKELGFRLSIDDFGTGYSSLKYLKDLPVSELKIDRSFVLQIPEQGQPEDMSRTAITRAIIHLANEFKLSVVAEGVETENQKNFLLQNGCDVIQGYLFSPPVSANEFAAMLLT